MTFVIVILALLAYSIGIFLTLAIMHTAHNIGRLPYNPGDICFWDLRITLAIIWPLAIPVMVTVVIIQSISPLMGALFRKTIRGMTYIAKEATDAKNNI